jgi:hypothetical protein
MLIDSKLEEKGLSPNDWKSAKKFIADLMTMDANLLVSLQELTQFLETEFSSIIETDSTCLLEEVELYCMFPEESFRCGTI